MPFPMKLDERRRRGRGSGERRGRGREREEGGEGREKREGKGEKGGIKGRDKIHKGQSRSRVATQSTFHTSFTTSLPAVQFL